MDTYFSTRRLYFYRRGRCHVFLFLHMSTKISSKILSATSVDRLTKLPIKYSTIPLQIDLGSSDGRLR
jgi:hypothetical protein